MADDEVFWSPDVLAEYDSTCTFIPTTSSKKRRRNNTNEEESANKSLHSYWLKRYSYFTRYDDGVLIDRTGWFSVTPEHTASEIAAMLPQGALVYDGFAGIGGNAIQFALAGCDVIASEYDWLRACMCAHNVRVYECRPFVDVVNGDFFEVVEGVRADVVFLSPPWGGPQVNKQPVFRLASMDGLRIFECARKAAPNIIYYLPRHTSITDIAALAPKEHFRIIIHRDQDGQKVVAVSALFGPMFIPEDTCNV